MNYSIPTLCLAGLLSLSSCQPAAEQTTGPAPAQAALAKFEPPAGKCLLFVGQELEAIGGLEAYSDGYYDHFEAPGGFTMYTNFRPGDESFGHIYKGVDGVKTTDDWGDSPSNMSLQIADEDFAHSALAIGLELVNHTDEIAAGVHDSLILELGTFLQSLGRRPVFLRIGYEFDGHAWNHYNREEYLGSFHRIKDMYDSMGIDNIAYVWQCTGWGSDYEALEAWYPGDEYVDWCGYSHFARWPEAQPMLDFARNHQKPVFVAEATPTLGSPTVKEDGQTIPLDLNDPEQAQQAWDEWFVPFFETIHQNEDVIKAISYINCYWKSHPMWENNPTFQYVDARLQQNEMISEKWKAEMASGRYLHSSAGLFDQLWGDKK